MWVQRYTTIKEYGWKTFRFCKFVTKTMRRKYCTLNALFWKNSSNKLHPWCDRNGARRLILYVYYLFIIFENIFIIFISVWRSEKRYVWRSETTLSWSYPNDNNLKYFEMKNNMLKSRKVIKKWWVVWKLHKENFFVNLMKWELLKMIIFNINFFYLIFSK